MSIIMMRALIWLLQIDHTADSDAPLSYFFKFINSHCFPERIFEDHENLVENLLNWTRDSTNRLMFIERIEKYALFKNPQVREADVNFGPRAVHLFMGPTVSAVCGVCSHRLHHSTYNQRSDSYWVQIVAV